jgi:hypothetical protein
LGSIIGNGCRTIGAQEFRHFLDIVETNVPVDLDIHAVMDNASSHATRLIGDWFTKRPRWQRPTSSS